MSDETERCEWCSYPVEDHPITADVADGPRITCNVHTENEQ